MRERERDGVGEGEAGGGGEKVRGWSFITRVFVNPEGVDRFFLLVVIFHPDQTRDANLLSVRTCEGG